MILYESTDSAKASYKWLSIETQLPDRERAETQADQGNQ